MKQVPNPQRGMALSWMKNLDRSPSAPRRCHQQSDPDSPYFYISISTQGQHVKTKKTESPLEHVQYITRPPQLRSTYTTPAQPPRSHIFCHARTRRTALLAGGKHLSSLLYTQETEKSPWTRWWAWQHPLVYTDRPTDPVRSSLLQCNTHKKEWAKKPITTSRPHSHRASELPSLSPTK